MSATRRFNRIINRLEQIGAKQSDVDYLKKQQETIIEADKVIKMLSDKLSVYENCDTCEHRLTCTYPKIERCALYER